MPRSDRDQAMDRTGEIIVGYNGNGAYVYKAALKVMLE
jgi:hypothetical protein